MNDRNNTPAVVTALTLLIVGLLILCAAGLLAFRWVQVQAARAAMAAARERELAVQAEASAALARVALEGNRRQAAASGATAGAAEGTGAAAANGDPPEAALEPDDRPTAIEDAVRDVLRQQQQAWNAGDIDRFMQHYWPSDKLTFSSRGKLTRSWQSVLENYRKRYSSREAMGELSLDDLEITLLGPEAALVLGNWTVRRQNESEETIGGNFTLVFRLLDGKWLIIHDHTSRAEEP